MRSQHEFRSIRDDGQRTPPDAVGYDTPLSVALRKLTSRGVRVLGFWRTRGGWTLKVMAGVEVRRDG